MQCSTPGCWGVVSWTVPLPEAPNVRLAVCSGCAQVARLHNAASRMLKKGQR